MTTPPDAPRTPPRPFGAVLTAMATPLDADGALDLDGAARLATSLVDAGCDGLVLNGTTGESPTTSPEEKARVVRAVLEAVGDRAHVLTGAGSNDTAGSVEAARAAEAAGAHGLLVVTPYYSKPPQEGLLAHFRAVADATGLPVMVYDIPGRTATPVEVTTLRALAEHPRVVAVKDSKNDLLAASQVMASTDLAWYSGEDALNLAHLAQGAAGVVSVVAHAAAGAYRQMVDAVDAGDLPTARALHVRLLPVVDAMMTRTQGAASASAVAQLLGATPHRTVRLPLVALTGEQLEHLRGALTEAGLL
ncbi:4-hydroxy-tetrahydrodipicolinate synthase [uncultured Pseudokineococcus sp.]|uniref:4-hydroxy-tetrahydrodipicolinate synthase n=1 Tax=uncultured Pseudokineococcus sp. TaxID=1642928 RepID=UPI002635C88D|nr:4-hydroxy-tetrahydrodipicolinate synthase [uncultured Pseudokineococcus sp.]